MADWTAQECADYAGLSSRRIFSVYANRGQAPAPYKHVGRTPLWHSEEVIEWVNNRPGKPGRPRVDKLPK